MHLICITLPSCNWRGNCEFIPLIIAVLNGQLEDSNYRLVKSQALRRSLRSRTNSAICAQPELRTQCWKLLLNKWWSAHAVTRRKFSLYSFCLLHQTDELNKYSNHEGRATRAQLISLAVSFPLSQRPLSSCSSVTPLNNPKADDLVLGKVTASDVERWKVPLQPSCNLYSWHSGWEHDYRQDWLPRRVGVCIFVLAFRLVSADFAGFAKVG